MPVLAVLLAAQAMAPQPTCAATVAPPPALAAWSSPVVITAAVDAAHGTSAMLAAGSAGSVALQPVATLHYAVPPGHPGAAGSFGGIVMLSVATAGRYQVAVGAGAWIDVIGAGGHALTSIAHGQGPACTGIRKIVAFDLAPGRYLVQLSGAPSASIKLLAAQAK